MVPGRAKITRTNGHTTHNANISNIKHNTYNIPHRNQTMIKLDCVQNEVYHKCEIGCWKQVYSNVVEYQLVSNQIKDGVGDGLGGLVWSHFRSQIMWRGHHWVIRI